MANPEQLAILKQGVKVWNEWRENYSEINPDLSGADLKGHNLFLADLRKSNLSRSNLDQAILRKANLSAADLTDATLRKAKMDWAKIGGANLTRANLRNASMSGTYLNRTNFSEANLGKASLTAAVFTGAILLDTDFTGAHLGGTLFGDVDLSAAKGLNMAKHFGPSTIGIDAVYLSNGNIPEIFLRGCGVPETFITYARSLVGKPIDFYSCFISHSSKNKRFCERLYADLKAKDVRVWYFPEDAKWGESVWGEIDHSIKIYDKLIIVCSKNSLTSGPVLREIERALNREDKECKNVLFPIAIDRYIFDEWEHPRKADVLAKVVGTDFVGWHRNADKYDKAFKKLLKALKT